MKYGKSRTPCANCLKSFGGLPYSPPFLFCDGDLVDQNWYTSPSGAPYVDDGTLSGWNYLNGSRTLTASGGVLSSTGSTDFTVYDLPVVLTQDFTFSCDVRQVDDLSFAFGMLLMDQDKQKALFCVAGAGSPGAGNYNLSAICHYSDNPTGPGGSGVVLAQVNNAPGIFPVGSFCNFIVKRVGGFFYMTVNNVDVILLKQVPSVFGKLCIGFLGDSRIEIKNIVVNLP